jgi:hypothetical protein
MQAGFPVFVVLVLLLIVIDQSRVGAAATDAFLFFVFLPAPIPWRSESGPKVLSSQLGRKICGKALSELGNASGDP